MTQITSHKTGQHNRALGRRGEEIAATYLESLGFEILDRNWRAGRQGELDLVAWESGSIVAVEVKTRSGTGYGKPFESITRLKMSRLRRLLFEWVRTHPVNARALRVDAIAITVNSDDEPKIEHLRSIS